jgi:hypothetical protein
MIEIIWSKIWTFKQQCFKVIKIPIRLNIFLVSIWNPKIPKNCLARKPTFQNWLSYHTHMQGRLHSHARHNSQQLVRICRRDPTRMLALWTWQESNIFKNCKKGLVTFTISYHMFLLNIWNSTSNWSHVSLPSTKRFAWNSMAKIKLIIVTKASNNN